jgi:hypothetical protein
MNYSTQFVQQVKQIADNIGNPEKNRRLGHDWAKIKALLPKGESGLFDFQNKIRKNYSSSQESE